MTQEKLFISFSSKDENYAKGFEEALAQKVGSENIFFSPKSISPGEQYYDCIMQYIENCDAFILLASAHSVGCEVSNVQRSKEVDGEIYAAYNTDIPIYPIDIDGVLKRRSYDKGTSFLISRYQYIDGNIEQTECSYDHIINNLLNALSQDKVKAISSVEERLLIALKNGNIKNATIIAQSVNFSELNGDAAVLAIIAKLHCYPSLSNLSLNDASKISQELKQVLQSDCSEVYESLGLYIAGLLCKEYFQKCAIKSPLGSYKEIKQKAQKLPRLSFANKKLVRNLSKDYLKFEVDWFHGS